jgi:hypothetical protein
MTPAMQTALGAANVTIFGAIRIALPAHTIRVLDGAGELTVFGETFTGIDSVYGALYTADAMSDGAGDQAPAIQFGFLPPSSASISGIADPLAQGSDVKLIVGAIVGGAVVADPDILFQGSLDQIDVDADVGKLSVAITAVSAMELFFDNQEGVRLSPSWHKSVWPGETGLDNVTAVTRKIWWGTNDPAPSVTSFGGGGGGLRVFGDGQYLRAQ